MLVFVPKEVYPDETRVPLNPDGVKKLTELGAEVAVEAGLGATCGFADADYAAAGAQVSNDRTTLLGKADLVLRLNKPPLEEVSLLKRGAVHISYLDPFNEHGLVDAFVAAGVSTISMEMVPRTTLAQKMDALSSQANIAGYEAVLLGATKLKQVLPMMMTPAGTLKPARVFVIGVGVAGLQAIATAKRLGARVEAFDTRPVVEEQVRSLGAKFIKVDLGETGETSGGYAKELTPEQLKKQQEAMAKVVAQSDIVITTAQVFGRKAPLIVTRAMLSAMRPGSVVVDMAAESGGNVEGSIPGEETVVDGVTVVGAKNLPGCAPIHATQMYSANLCNLIEHFWDKQTKSLRLKTEDEIMNGCLVAHEGAIRSEMVKNARESK